MTDAAEKILEEAMKLPPEVRSRIAQQLMDSVAANDDMDPEERAELLAAFEEAEQEFDAGLGVSEAEMGTTLRATK